MSTEDKDNSTQTNRTTTELQPYKDPEVLEQLYVEDDHTQTEIAEIFNVKQPTVSYWLDKHRIEREEPDVYRSVNDDGRTEYVVPTEETHFYQYQLNALLDYRVDDVFDPFTHVHHLMASPYKVDLPANLRVMNRREHVRSHAEGTAVDPPSKVLQFYFDGEVEDYAHFGSKEERVEDWERLKEEHGIDDDRGGDDQ
jgi:hypothetical protein